MGRHFGWNAAGSPLCYALYSGRALFARGSDFLFCSSKVSWRSASSSSSFSSASALFVPRSSTLSLMARRACSTSLGSFAGSCWRRAARNRIVQWVGMGKILDSLGARRRGRSVTCGRGPLSKYECGLACGMIRAVFSGASGGPTVVHRVAPLRAGVWWRKFGAFVLGKSGESPRTFGFGFLGWFLFQPLPFCSQQFNEAFWWVLVKLGDLTSTTSRFPSCRRVYPDKSGGITSDRL